MEYMLEIAKKMRGFLITALFWFVGNWYYSKQLVGAVGSTPEAWKSTSHYMIFLFVLVVLCLILRSRITVAGVAVYGFALCAQQVGLVMDKQMGFFDFVGERIAPMFVGLNYIAEKIGFGLGELAEHGLCAFYGLFIGVVACAAWCFVNPGDGSNFVQRAKHRRGDYRGQSAVSDPLASRRSSRVASRPVGQHEAPAKHAPAKHTEKQETRK